MAGRRCRRAVARALASARPPARMPPRPCGHPGLGQDVPRGRTGRAGGRARARLRPREPCPGGGAEVGVSGRPGRARGAAGGARAAGGDIRRPGAPGLRAALEPDGGGCGGRPSGGRIRGDLGLPGPPGRPAAPPRHPRRYIDWRRGRRFAGVEAVLGALAAALGARRRAEDRRDLPGSRSPCPPPRPLRPTGVLSHHLVHDAAAWRFLEDLIAWVEETPGVRWVRPRDALAGRAPAGAPPGDRSPASGPCGPAAST